VTDAPKYGDEPHGLIVDLYAYVSQVQQSAAETMKDVHMDEDECFSDVEEDFAFDEDDTECEIEDDEDLPLSKENVDTSTGAMTLETSESGEIPGEEQSASPDMESDDAENVQAPTVTAAARSGTTSNRKKTKKSKRKNRRRGRR